MIYAWIGFNFKNYHRIVRSLSKQIQDVLDNSSFISLFI